MFLDAQNVNRLRVTKPSIGKIRLADSKTLSLYHVEAAYDIAGMECKLKRDLGDLALVEVNDKTYAVPTACLIHKDEGERYRRIKR